MANERDARGEAAKDDAEARLRLTFGNVLKLSRGSGSRSGFICDDKRVLVKATNLRFYSSNREPSWRVSCRGQSSRNFEGILAYGYDENAILKNSSTDKPLHIWYLPKEIFSDRESVFIKATEESIVGWKGHELPLKPAKLPAVFFPGTAMAQKIAPEILPTPSQDEIPVSVAKVLPQEKTVTETSSVADETAGIQVLSTGTLTTKIVDYLGLSLEILIANSGKLWFESGTVSKILALSDSDDILKLLPSKGIIRFDTVSASSESKKKYLSEANLHRLIFRTGKMGAEEFLDWICDDALPAMRAIGSKRMADTLVATTRIQAPILQEPPQSIPPSKTSVPQAQTTLSTSLTAEVQMKATEAEIEKEVWALRERRYKALLSQQYRS